jgi:hypothetical protein
MIYIGVNLTHTPESGLSIFRGWGLVPIGGFVDTCVEKCQLVSKENENEGPHGRRKIEIKICSENDNFIAYCSALV